MRFRALLYKELRECMPYALGAAILLIICGFTTVQFSIAPDRMDNKFVTFSEETTDYDWSWNLFMSPFINEAGSFTLVFAIILGIALGIRQYAAESFSRTWGFLLHHSVNRGAILSAKLLAAMLSFVPLAFIWLLFYIYAHNTQYFPIPPAERTLIEGLIFAAFGYMAYLSIAMAALNKAKWYTTKKISIAFGIWMFVNLVVQVQIWLGWLTIIIASTILLIQITDNFLNREFE